MGEKDSDQRSWLSYVNLSDEYERKARFLPGVLATLFLLPLLALLGAPTDEWFKVLIADVGVGAVLAVGISHLASAAGNRFQERLWPQWPHDSPTNRWLLPENTERSRQQREAWYESIKRVIDLDIKAASESEGRGEVRALINDAVAALRYRLRNSPSADRLRIHNIDFGFARNFAGLRSLWLLFAVTSCFGCWASHIWRDGDLLWSVISTVIALLSFLLAFVVMPDYVRRKADRYAESFFGAITELNRQTRNSNERQLE